MTFKIIIEAASADEMRQYVHDLALVLPLIKNEDFPTDTHVAAPAAPAVPYSPPPAAPVSATYPPQYQGAAPTGATTYAAPTAAAPQAPAETAPAAPVATPGAAPTTAPTYDFNQLATATMQLQQAGKNIFEYFGKFGIQALNQLPKERYAEYAALLRQEGAKI